MPAAGRPWSWDVNPGLSGSILSFHRFSVLAWAHPENAKTNVWEKDGGKWHGEKLLWWNKIWQYWWIWNQSEWIYWKLSHKPSFPASGILRLKNKVLSDLSEATQLIIPSCEWDHSPYSWSSMFVLSSVLDSTGGPTSLFILRSDYIFKGVFPQVT